MNRSARSLFNTSRWAYLVYAGLAALVAAIKGFFYAHLLDEIQYASVNYYLLIVGAGSLLVSAGVIVRCHTEIPLLTRKPEEELINFINQVKNTGFLTWIVLCTILLLAQNIITLSAQIQILSTIQVLVLFLFTIDLMCIKGRLDFIGYAKRLFNRNALIALSGFAAAYLTADASRTVFAEVICAVVFYWRGIAAFVSNIEIPKKIFLHQSLSFIPVTIVGAFLQFADRLLASSVLPPEDFSKYSYFSLIVLAGLSIQQLVNTRVITVLPEICEKNSKHGFIYTAKISATMAIFLLLVLSTGMYLLQSPWFAASWVVQDYYTGSFFVFIALARSIDFYSSYLLAMGKKHILFCIQLASSVLFLLVFIYHSFISIISFSTFLILACTIYATLLLSLTIASWSIRNVKATIS